MTSRERIIDSAFQLFYAKGFAAVGTQEVCDLAGVLKGTLYHHFATKLDIAVAALQHYGTSVRQHFEAVAKEKKSARDRVLLIFEAAQRVAEGHQKKEGVMFGCFHGNLTLELAATQPVIRDTLNQITEFWVSALVPIIQDLIAEGEIPPIEERLAGHLIMAYLHGVVLAAKSINRPQQIQEMTSHVFGLLGGQASVTTPKSKPKKSRKKTK